MTEDVKTQIIKRLKSLAWRVGVYAAVLLVAFVAQNLGLFHLNPIVETGIAFVLGEVTKFLNTKESELESYS